MRPRFTLRTLLILTAIAAAACYWFARPTIMAKEFVAALNRGDRDAAMAMIVLSPPLDGIDPGHLLKEKCVEFSATVEPLSWRNLWQARRGIQCKMSAVPRELVGQTNTRESIIRTAVDSEAVEFVANYRGIEIDASFHNFVTFIDEISKRRYPDDQ